MIESDRFKKAIEAFDAYHRKDPNTETHDGKVYPKELLYARRMTEKLLQFRPDADEVVKLAARSQHIGRWEIPRSDYPMDKKGYLQWRSAEKLRHAKIAETILDACGYPAHVIKEVKDLLLKKELKTNPKTQLIEDVVCLVFIEHYLEAFAAKHDDEKIKDILRKTVTKMSAEARSTITKLKIPEKIQLLIASISQ
jgi:hypothetical protein